IACGTPSDSLRRKIAVPDTLSGGDKNSEVRNSCNGIACFCRFSNTSSRPRFQVSIIVNKTAHNNSGNQQIGRAHSELQSLMRTSYAVFCLKKKKNTTTQ